MNIFHKNVKKNLTEELLPLKVTEEVLPSNFTGGQYWNNGKLLGASAILLGAPNNTPSINILLTSMVHIDGTISPLKKLHMFGAYNHQQIRNIENKK